MMRKRLKNIWFRMFAGKKLRKIEHDLSYKYGSITIALQPGIFHPRYFKSSQLLLKWIEDQDLNNRKIVEVGSGSGIASLRAAQKGGQVIAIDINPKAINQLTANALDNNLRIDVIESDLFDNVPNQAFDSILINPPFYPKKARSFAEKAWFCGEEFEFYQKLFHQLNEREYHEGIIMTLSDDCDLDRIQKIAQSCGYRFYKEAEVRSIFERNYLFNIRSERID